MILVSLALISLLLATAVALYYFILTMLGWSTRPLDTSVTNSVRVSVLIPAHNEESTIAIAIHSLQAADPSVRIFVIADNCTDRTAQIARRCGVECLERNNLDQRGKGYALTLGITHALADHPDAIMIMDADCEISRESMRVIRATLAQGAEVVQTAVVNTRGDGTGMRLVTAVGTAIENALTAGTVRLGGSAHLRGTGMIFCRNVLERYPWDAVGATEDAEYSASLRAAGVRIRFAAEAEVISQPPPSQQALSVQRQRWRTVFRTSGPGSIARLIGSKPLVLLQLLVTLGLVGACLVQEMSPITMALAGWSCLVCILTAMVYVRAWRRIGARSRDLWQLGTGAVIVARLAGISLAGFVHRTNDWVRTPRHAELQGEQS